jgi:hypothetical protein
MLLVGRASQRVVIVIRNVPDRVNWPCVFASLSIRPAETVRMIESVNWRALNKVVAVNRVPHVCAVSGIVRGWGIVYEPALNPRGGFCSDGSFTSTWRNETLVGCRTTFIYIPAAT